MSVCRFVALALLVAAPGPVLASPFETLDQTPAHGLEVAGMVDHDRRDGAETSAVALSLIAGLGANTEASLTLAHGWEAQGRHSRREGGLDPSLALKWRFHDSGGWAAAAEPSLSAPMGELTDGEWRLRLPFGIRRQFDRASLSAMVGYDHGFGNAGDDVFGGVLGTYAISDTLVVGAELAANAPAGNFSAGEVRGNIGFIWDMSDRLQMYGLAGRVLEGPEGGTLMRIALHVAF